MVQQFAHSLRTEDLDNHVVFYRTQNLGGFEVSQVEKYGFDTARLRPVLTMYLARRNIHTPFRFLMRQHDSTLNSASFPDSIKQHFFIISKAFPTYKLTNDTEQYVRVLFNDPAGYILSRMRWLFFSAIALTGLIGYCLYVLLKTLHREKRLSAMKNDFIDNITHELKTPIATVSAAVEALSDFGALQDERKATRYLQHSRSELERLNGLVNKVLNLSVYERGRFEIQQEPVHIETVIREVMDTLTLSAAKEITYHFTNSSPLQYVQVDKLHFRQVITNLLDNAIKYSGDTVCITIDCYKEGSFLMIAIQDNGIGIRSGELPLVFDRFYRVAANNHAVKGHGLGLNYVKSIVERQGGWIKISSMKGEGTIVKTAWPL